MKLNELHFFSGTVITHFLNKPYQEINFKSHLSSVLTWKEWEILSDLHMNRVIVFTFTMRLKSSNYKKHGNILVFYDQ